MSDKATFRQWDQSAVSVKKETPKQTTVVDRTTAPHTWVQAAASTVDRKQCSVLVCIAAVRSGSHDSRYVDTPT